VSGGSFKEYDEARAVAQREADADGMDRGLERMPDYTGRGGHVYRVFLLPGRHERCGHELRCEVVMCSDLRKCRPWHGPEAPRHVPTEDKLAMARGLGRLRASVGLDDDA
jgi:hypothetical protein